VVTITGNNYNPDKTGDVVKFFNGITATVSAASVTTLTVTVPASATTGPIQVTSWGNTATSAASFTVLPMSDNVQPFALNASLVSGRANNTAMGTIASGLGVDQFCWLSWTNDMGDTALQTSISMTPNSATYANPLDATDHYLDVGDWINAKSNTANTTRTAIDNIKTTAPGTIRNVIVPLFNSANLGSTPQRVQITGFALIQVTDRALNGTGSDLLTMTFLRTCDSAGN
jgi:hypothetical protein